MSELRLQIERRLSHFTLDLDLAVDREIVALFGRCGVGKTQTLECVAGLARPQRGEIRLGAEVLYRELPGQPSVNAPPRRRRVGYVLQDGALFPHRSLLQNVGYALRRQGQAGEEKARLMLDQAGIGGLAHRFPHEVSGGQRKRAAIARALAADPGVLLLDEPFVHLDRVVRAKLMEDLAALVRERALPTLLVTHDIDVVLRCADRLAVIDDGRIVQRGTVDQVLFHPSTAGVARLLGDVNLLDGQVTGIVNGMWSIQTRGALWRVPHVGALGAGASVEVMIRTSAIKLLKADRPVAPELTHNQQDARLVALERRPDLARVTFELADGVRLAALLSPAQVDRSGLAEGSACRIAIDLGGIALLPSPAQR
jgi:molybdate transport system ATP-binding protein